MSKTHFLGGTFGNAGKAFVVCGGLNVNGFRMDKTTVLERCQVGEIAGLFAEPFLDVVSLHEVSIVVLDNVPDQM